MIVASFFAPREDVWKCDYDELLEVLDKSCKRLSLRHVVISDEQRPYETAIFELSDNLMEALIDGQRQLLELCYEPVLLVGADCVVTRDPRRYFGDKSLAVTVGPFLDCPMNTGAIFVKYPQKAKKVWEEALKLKPREWGEDQKTLWKATQEFGDFEEIDARNHNWAPDSVGDRCIIQEEEQMPTVVHFRGERKRFMVEWARRHLGIQK